MQNNTAKIACKVHEDENISYYCLEQQCKQGPLMCVLCAFASEQYNQQTNPLKIVSHTKSHQIKPIKYFIKQLKKDRQMLQTNNINLLSKIDTLHEQLLQLCEHPLVTAADKDGKNNDNIHQLLTIVICQSFEQIYRQCRFDVVSDYYEYVDGLKHKEGSARSSSSKIFQTIICRYANIWKLHNDEDDESGCTYGRMINSIIHDITDKKQTVLQSIQKKQIDISLVEMFKSETSSKKFYFTPKLMNSGLTFVQKTKIKIGNYADYNYFALCEPALSSHKVQKITFKMTSLTSYVTVGICIKSKVDGNYEFVSGSIGHGSYQISYDGYLWSDHDSSVNQQYSGWYFNQGDTVTVEVNPKTKNIRFIKNNDQPNAKQMAFQAKKNDKMHFCVSLNSQPQEIDIAQ